MIRIVACLIAAVPVVAWSAGNAADGAGTPEKNPADCRRGGRHRKEVAGSSVLRRPLGWQFQPRDLPRVRDRERGLAEAVFGEASAGSGDQIRQSGDVPEQ